MSDEYKRLLNSAADGFKQEVKDMVGAEHGWRRFPDFPPDIVARADALLLEKYPDGIVDPRFVEIACEAMMAQREIDAKVCEDEKQTYLSPQYASNQPLGSMLERFACDECAKAIRGTT